MNMGLQFGLESGKHCKRQHRWLFSIPEVCGDPSAGANSLPPEKGSRPTLTFKEAQVNHQHEEVYIPVKPDWRPVTLTLYDLKNGSHPVFKWIKTLYNPLSGTFGYPVTGNLQSQFIRYAILQLFDGCGTPIEIWVWEDVWPQSTNFQSLDMTVSGLVTCEITLRYARAYVFP